MSNLVHVSHYFNITQTSHDRDHLLSLYAHFPIIVAIFFDRFIFSHHQRTIIPRVYYVFLTYSCYTLTISAALFYYNLIFSYHTGILITAKVFHIFQQSPHNHIFAFILSTSSTHSPPIFTSSNLVFIHTFLLCRMVILLHSIATLFH